MSQMPISSPTPVTYAKERAATQRDIRDLYRRTRKGGSGGGVLVHVGPTEPEIYEIGTLWFDTDSDVGD